MKSITNKIKEDYLEIFNGPMNVTEVNRKIAHYTLNYNPKELLIKMERTQLGYHTTIYIQMDNLKNDKN